MKKLMALCLAMLMALSMVSFSVMAEDVATVAFEDIANGQPAAFVTGNLSLGENVITSSNEAVIALDGTVNRPIYEDATVSLTINGGVAFDVVVKAKTTNVLHANDFSSATTGWTIGCATGNTASSIVDGKFHFIIGDTTNGRTNIQYAMPALASDGIVTIQFDMSNITDLANSGMDIRMAGSRYDAEGNKIGQFNTITIARCNSASGFGNITKWVSSMSKNVVISYNPTTGELWGNGAIATNNLFTCAETNFSYNEGKSAADCAKAVITGLTICNAGGSCTATFDMDDLVISQAVSAEDALAGATVAEKVATYSKYLDESYITNGGSVSSVTDNLVFAPDAELPAGVEVVWSSTNTAVVANDGTVKRPLTEPATVSVTGAINVDGTPAYTKTHSLTVLPHTMVFLSETADAENLTVGNLAGVDNWTPTSIKAWEMMEVAQEENGNKFFRFSTSSYEPSGSTPKYTFKSVPTYAEGDTIVFEAKFKMPSIPSGGYGTNFEFYLNSSQMNEFIYMSSYLYDNDYNSSVNDYHGGGGRSDVRVTAGQWYNLRMEVSADPDNTVGATSPTGYIAKSYINDKLVGTSRTYAAVPATITSAEFRVKGRQNADSTSNPTAPNLIYDIDDLRVYTTRPLTNVLPSLTAEEKVQYFKGLIQNSEFGAAATGMVYDLDKTYEGFDLEACDTTITWASSNTEYISNAGAVLKGAAIGQNVSVDMTATITSGNVTDTVTFNFPISVEGTTIVKSIDNEGLTGSISNAVYADGGEGHGTAIRLTSDTADTKIASFTDIQTGGRADRLVFSTDYKFVPTDEGASGGIRLLAYSGAIGLQLQFYYNTGEIGFFTTKAYANAAATDKEVAGGYSATIPMPQHILEKGTGEWINISVDYAPMSQTYQIYLDGVLLNEIPFLQGNMDLGSNTGSAFRGYGVFTSTGKGESWIDNMTVSKYTDADVAEVNAALNAALVDYASEYVHPVLTNCQLPSMTIGTSWITADEKGYAMYNRDLENGAIKPSNVSTYTYVTDGPQITWEIDGVAATELNVTSPKEVTIKVTATKNGVSMSKTFTRKVAPVAIRSLGLGTASCLNGAWLEGAAGTEKVIVGIYNEDALVAARVFSLADAEKYDSATGLLKDLGISNPKENADYDQLKIFIVDANGITPVSFMDASLKD